MTVWLNFENKWENYIIIQAIQLLIATFLQLILFFKNLSDTIYYTYLIFMMISIHVYNINVIYVYNNINNINIFLCVSAIWGLHANFSSLFLVFSSPKFFHLFTTNKYYYYYYYYLYYLILKSSFIFTFTYCKSW